MAEDPRSERATSAQDTLVGRAIGEDAASDTDDLVSKQAIGALAANPVVVEVVRIASEIAGTRAEVVVFADGKVSIVGALGTSILQPRPYTEAERALLDGTVLSASCPKSFSFAVLGPDRRPVGALTLGSDASISHDGAFRGLARLAASVVEAEGEAITSGGRAQGANRRRRADDLAVDVVDNLRDAVIIVDENMAISYANKSVTIQLARTPAELVGMSVADLVHPEDLADVFEAIVRLATGNEVYRMKLRVEHPDGHYIPIEVTGNDRSSHQSLRGLVLSVRDGHGDSELDRMFERNRRLSSAIIDRLHDGILATDAVGSLIVVNDAARQLLGLGADSTLADTPIDRLEFLDQAGELIKGDRHPLRRVVGGESLSDEAMSVYDGVTVRRLVANGRPVTDSAGEVIGSVLSVQDVTEALAAENELRRRALHDELTGLPNRRHLDERLAEVTAEHDTNEHTAPVAGCLIDLDNFKTINDTFGHRMGDLLLQAAADRLSAGLENDDLLVRLGGDEFVVLLRSASPEAAMRSADRIQSRFSEPFEIQDQVFAVTCSIGVSYFEKGDLNDGALLRCADIALYAAKDRGRSCSVLFDEELSASTELELRQREMLRRVLDEDGLVMHFQPIVDAMSGRLLGFESLARCIDDDGRLLGPDSFLDAIDGSGLVWTLDRKAFALTCAGAASIHSLKLKNCQQPTMACNFSALSIQQPDFFDFVVSATADHGLKPADICLEVTESAAFHVGAGSVNALRRLAEAGFGIALDDFGTGYSSLSHLRDLPLTTVKVDKSFITRLGHNSTERAIALAVVKLAANLGLDVVAEGVETGQQLMMAKELGFRAIQGWYFSRAMDIAHTLELLKQACSDGEPPWAKGWA